MDAQVKHAAEAMIYGQIGTSGLDAQGFAAGLRRLRNVDRLTLLINSHGGSLVDGIAIYKLLLGFRRDTGATISARVDQIAGSCASLIAMAAQRVEMQPGSWITVHDPIWGRCLPIGEHAEKLCTEALRGDRDFVVGVYAQRTGLTPDEISAMMAANDGEGTWMDARRAVELGFADALAATYDQPCSLGGWRLGAWS